MCNRHTNVGDTDHNHCARLITASARDVLSRDEKIRRLKLWLASGYAIDESDVDARTQHMNPKKPARSFTERPTEETKLAMLASGDFTLVDLECLDADLECSDA